MASSFQVIPCFAPSPGYLHISGVHTLLHWAFARSQGKTLTRHVEDADIAPASSGPNDPRSDHDLVTAINAGGPAAPAAFEALYRRYRDWTVTLAYRFTADRDLALDVMQETFLYVLGKFPGFVLTSQFKTFLYPVVRHVAISVQQKSRRLVPLDDATADAIPAADVKPAVAAPANARNEWVAALAHLPAAHREVLILRFVDDLSLADIAAAVGVPLGTIKSRLHHALQTLRDDPRTADLFES